MTQEPNTLIYEVTDQRMFKDNSASVIELPIAEDPDFLLFSKANIKELSKSRAKTEKLHHLLTAATIIAAIFGPNILQEYIPNSEVLSTIASPLLVFLAVNFQSIAMRNGSEKRILDKVANRMKPDNRVLVQFHE